MFSTTYCRCAPRRGAKNASHVDSWQSAACRYLMGHFNPGWPFARDYLTARRTLVPLIKLWASDHLSLFARPLPLPTESRSHR
jgi:hypothetical protein